MFPILSDRVKRLCQLLVLACLLTCPSAAKGQTYTLETVNDTLSYLVLTTDAGVDRWRLTFPVYRMCVGDVDGDGSDDVLVGVTKTTRFHPVVARRVFIFKNHHGWLRALWMGSRLGGILEDFRFCGGHVVTLQATTDGRYAVLEHEWRKFGLGARRFLVAGVSHEEALAVFNEAF